MDIEKGFDSLDHDFLISTLEKYGFGQKLFLRVKILLNTQESYLLMSVKLQSTLYSVEVPVKVTQFQRFYSF